MTDKKMTQAEMDKITEDAKAKSSQSKLPVKINKEYFSQNRGVGLEELSPEDLPTPTLFIIQPNNKDVDSEGRPFIRGQFLYKGDNTARKEVMCSFISFTKKELPSFTDKSVLVKNYVFMGAMEPSWKPFLLYLKSTGIGAAKQFLGAVNASQIPMYAHRVMLTTEKVESEKGTYYKIKFNLVGVREDTNTVLMLEKLARKYAPQIKEETEENQPGSNPSDGIPF